MEELPRSHQSDQSKVAEVPNAAKMNKIPGDIPTRMWISRNRFPMGVGQTLFS